MCVTYMPVLHMHCARMALPSPLAPRACEGDANNANLPVVIRRRLSCRADFCLPIKLGVNFCSGNCDFLEEGIGAWSDYSF